MQAGFPVGLLLANLVFLVCVHLPGTWAWRVPFLLSIVLVIVGLIIRSKIPESPVFEEVKARGEIVKNPITQVIREDWRNILRGIGLRIAETAGYAVAITFMLSYLKTENLADNTLTLVAICVASAIGIFATYNWGKATDRVGRRPIYLFGTLVMVVFAFPMFLLVNTGIAMLIVIAVVIAYAVCQNSLAGAQGVLVPRAVQRQHPLLRRLAWPTSSPPWSPGSPRSWSPCSTRPGAGSAPPPCSASTASSA